MKSLVKLANLIVIAAALLFLVILFTGCGADGAAGQQGPAGPQGPTGPQGEDAELPPYAVTSIVDPCGDAPGVIDEVLLKLANGQVLVSFSANANGNNTRLAILPPGNYVTTDGSNCAFTLTSTGQVL